jgi:hypothetical protein
VHVQECLSGQLWNHHPIPGVLGREYFCHAQSKHCHLAFYVKQTSTGTKDCAILKATLHLASKSIDQKYYLRLPY